MNILLSLISSGAIKWLSILILIFGLIGGAYQQHRKIVENEKLIALQQYNINQLEQNVKDKDTYIQKMKEISKHKSDIINDLYRKNDDLSNKAKDIEIVIERDKATGKDRDSSELLKNTFRELENMK
jgi:hypothetical protein